MKKAKNRLIAILLLFLLSSSSFIFYNSIENNASNNIIQEIDSPNLSNPYKSLLHTYDFEDETIGQDPSGVTLVVAEPTGCTANIETLGDGQQKHVALYKSGSSGRVMLRDNISYYGEIYDVGELHFKFYHDSSLFGIWLMDSVGILFRLDFWSGNVGQWAVSNIITSYSSNQWTNITIYYNISKGWMFDIDSVRYGGDYTYSFEHGGSNGLTKLEWVSAISAGGDGYFRIDDISFYYETEYLIKIMTPENKTYIEPMSGYYPATYGFENDKSGEQACEWFTENEANVDSQIIDSYKGHNKVYELSDNNPSDKADIINTFGNQSYGTIELWFLHYSSDYWGHVIISYWDPFVSIVWMTINPGQYLNVFNGTNQINITEFGIINADEWYHLRVDFRAAGAPPYMGLSEDSFILHLNGTKANDELLFRNTGYPISSIDLSTGWSAAGLDHLVYIDAVGYSWDDDYNIGDNLNEGLLLSFENSTALDWMGYSLDGQEIKTILGNTTFSFPKDGKHSIRVFGNDSLGTEYQSATRYFSTHHISIVTPENKTYIGPMSGYYPATYGFESDLPGADAKNWTHAIIGGTHSYIVDSYNGHERVYELYDNAAGNPDTYTNFNNQLSGTVEAWVLVSLSDYVIYLDINQGTSPIVRLVLKTRSYLIALNNSVSVNMTEFGIIQEDQWYHIRVDFRSALAGAYMGLAPDSYRIYLNAVQCNSDLLVNVPSAQVNRITFLTGWTAADPNYYVYFDAVGFSWDPDYSIGDNLNEGLLLSYENTTALDWQGFSLDGQPIYTIMGNTTIPFPEEGLHTIQVFANDSLGLNYCSDIRYFTTDYAIDIITPENKTYTEAMGGYYPAVFGFENQLPGVTPNDWIIYQSSGAAYLRTVDELDGHKKVLDFYSGVNGDYCYYEKNLKMNITNGTVEFWFQTTDVSPPEWYSWFMLSDGISESERNIRLCIRSGALTFFNSTDYLLVDSIVPNQWYHLRIDFNLIADTSTIYLNNVLKLSNVYNYGNGSQINTIHVTNHYNLANTHLYLDAIGYSWDPNYENGDNLEEGLLVSYENSTSLDWQGYSLDGQAAKTIMGNTTIPLPNDGQYTIQIFANDSLGMNYYSDIRYFTVRSVIHIITPENTTYTEPMSGYNPATYGFECDENNNFPKGWFDSSGANGYAKVIDGIGGHNKVLECYSSSLDDSRVDSSIFFDPQEQGSFEFWWYKSSSYTSAAIVDFWGETPGVCISIRVDHWPSADNDKVQYQTGAGYFDTGYTAYTDNKWMHFRIDFDCSSDTYSLWIDQVKYLDNIGFINSKDETGVNQMRFDSYNTANAVLYYVDAVSFSWDLGYSVGDNLYEGLLLSYENSTALDWQGYSLDGQAAITIMGNTTIPLPDVGQHTIQVFANDSLGLNYSSDLRYFTVNATQYMDIIAPVITINLPGLNTLFGTDAPPYDLTIVETNLNSMWYTLDGGLVNTTITEPTGTIALSIWSSRPNGTIYIRFYADDLTGNVGFEEVEVRKDILAPQITINTPIQNQVYYDTAPSFDLTIIEGNLDAIWYTLDDGILNFTCDISGNFNNLYWNAIPPGYYTLKFYATDTLGNLGSSEVSIEKKEPVIPGYNPLLVSLIIVVGIMGISLKIKKKSK